MKYGIFVSRTAKSEIAPLNRSLSGPLFSGLFRKIPVLSIFARPGISAERQEGYQLVLVHASTASRPGISNRTAQPRSRLRFPRTTGPDFKSRSRPGPRRSRKRSSNGQRFSNREFFPSHLAAVLLGILLGGRFLFASFFRGVVRFLLAGLGFFRRGGWRRGL